MRARRACVALALASLALAGCSSGPSSYINRNFFSLVVLPPVSKVDVDYAPAVVLPMVVKAARARGYRVLLKEELQRHFQSQGIASADLHSLAPYDIAQQLGVDGVVSVTITKWGEESLVLGTKDLVELKFQIHDRFGELVLEVKQHARKKRRFFSAIADMDPGDAAKLCRKVCQLAFSELKLAGYDPTGAED